MSAIDSPRESCSSSPRRTIGVAPSSATPTSKEIRVRVEGRTKTRPMLRAGEVLGADAARRGRLSARRARSSSSPSSNAPSSSPVRKSRFKAEILSGCPRLTAIAWNLFHGRDFPPDRDLFTWRSRLLRLTERNETHVQVNRELTARVRRASSTAATGTSPCCRSPRRTTPRPLAAACGAEAHRVLTSRNSLAPLRRLAARLNPDLIASGEGGSNLTLVRPGGALGPIVERRGIAIHEGRPERRAMALTRTESGVCVANLHATNDIPRAGGRGRPARRRAARSSSPAASR